MTDYTVVTPTASLQEELVENAARAHVLEVTRVSGQSFKRALKLSVDSSPDPKAMLGPDGQVLAMYGVSRHGRRRNTLALRLSRAA